MELFLSHEARKEMDKTHMGLIITHVCPKKSPFGASGFNKAEATFEKASTSRFDERRRKEEQQRL